MTFTNQELAAILKLAQVIAKADGKVTDSETTLMALELSRFGVSEVKGELIIALSNIMDTADATNIISRMTDEEKKYVAAYLGTMIFVDGEIDKKELILWNVFSQICKLPEMNIKDALEFMRNM
ncbi:MAG: TerB family tellurite resistance protein [Bacteroidaceae bacterium]|nr:TerB family tellurite resistance protein [Bacteroidaceae bacterium]